MVGPSSRRPLRVVACGVVALGLLASCRSGESGGANVPVSELTLVPDSIELGPDNCDPADQITPPRITFGGQTIDIRSPGLFISE
ncbi:MAG TPA: hypothetical protein PLV68_11775, partial [Ilumatobacteraceae bacterium]|nr:hypothetical protein [Ilumatobacteraceae bacterium]